jgi:aminopeptidase N/puromycin-sensitive aminopeptidase
MSSYLVALAVGDFECIEGVADSIPIRVCGTPDKKPLFPAALRYASEILKYYNQYYGIPYPFGKLDIVGAPDFDAGAMENTAAIFYRESLLFIDDKNSSIDSHQAVFEVLAHEMAHQWFGDLVTMKWWDNLWLNEGFATWMALKPSQALHPEWNATLDAVGATNGALQFDSLKSTHPIRAKAETPEAINELFDPISYEKGAAVLRMVEAYVSPDVFRRGVNAYLRKFAYNNATAEDFWQIITQTSGRPVNRIMPTFVDQAGEPLITVKAECIEPPPQPANKSRGKKSRRKPTPPPPKTQVTVSQQRFFADPSSSNDAHDASDAKELWSIPICIKSTEGKPFCQIFSQRRQTVPFTGCSPWVFTNANAVGYYRTQYDGNTLQKLGAVATTELSTAERTSLINDESALMGANKESIAVFLDLVAALNQDQERSVVESYGGSLQSMNDYLVTAQNRDTFHSWVRSNFRPMMEKLEKVGSAGSAAEKGDAPRLRSDLIGILGGVGEDPQTIQQATRLAEQYLADPNSVDPTIISTALAVAAHNGNSALFDKYLAALRQVNSPEQFHNIAYTISSFRSPELVQRWLDVTVSSEIRNQDAPHLIANIIGNRENQAVAWAWIKAHWPEVEKKITMSSGLDIIAATRSFCDAESRDDVQKFFTEHKVPAAERALRLATEGIDSCIHYRDHQQNNLAAWLSQHSATREAGTR